MRQRSHQINLASVTLIVGSADPAGRVGVHRWEVISGATLRTSAYRLVRVEVGDRAGGRMGCAVSAPRGRIPTAACTGGRGERGKRGRSERLVGSRPAGHQHLPMRAPVWWRGGAGPRDARGGDGAHAGDRGADRRPVRRSRLPARAGGPRAAAGPGRRRRRVSAAGMSGPRCRGAGCGIGRRARPGGPAGRRRWRRGLGGSDDASPRRRR